MLCTLIELVPAPDNSCIHVNITKIPGNRVGSKDYVRICDWYGYFSNDLIEAKGFQYCINRICIKRLREMKKKVKLLQKEIADTQALMKIDKEG